MMGYLLRRAGAAILTLWLAFTLAFFALRILPGDAVSATLARSGASSEQIAERRAILGLDQPLPQQYGQVLGGLLHGDFGSSLVSNRPVSDMIGEQFGATVILAAGALLVGVLIGVGLGIVVALGSSRWLRWSAALIVSLLLSSPIYWTGTLLITLFSLMLHLLPSAGSNDPQTLILPCLALGLSLAGSIARVTGDSLASLRDEDFVRTARAKGLRRRQIAIQHILRAGLAPVLAVIGLQAGFLLGGTVVTETLFVRQGIGQVLLSAIQDHDFPVVQGIVILSAIVYSVVNMITDLLTAAFDPRVSPTE
ncbi:MAG: ABC transporter permease [Chloroflexota bacterium]